MTAPRITAEEIAELRTQPHDNHTLVRRILDALESAYAELDRLSAQGGEVPEQAFKREDRYIVLKREDLIRYATPAQLRELERICQMIQTGREQEGKRINSYVVVADDWPEYEETWGKITARVTGVPAPPHPDTVEVPLSALDTSDLRLHRIEMRSGNPKRGNKASYFWMRAFANHIRAQAQPTTNETRG